MLWIYQQRKLVYFPDPPLEGVKGVQITLFLKTSRRKLSGLSKNVSDEPKIATGNVKTKYQLKCNSDISNSLLSFIRHTHCSFSVRNIFSV